MENTVYFMAIGYPIGLISEEEKKFLIEQKDDLYTVEAIDYLVWQLAFEFGDKELMLNKFKEISKQGESEFEFVIDRLLNAGMLIKVEESTFYDTYALFKELSFNKQGNGIGYSRNDDNINNYSVELKDEVRMSFFEYFVWSNGNGVKTIKNIVEDGMKVMNVDKETIISEFIPSIIFLYENNLIYFKR